MPSSTIDLLRFSLASHPSSQRRRFTSPQNTYNNHSNSFNNRFNNSNNRFSLISAKAVELKTAELKPDQNSSTTVVLDVTGMMCGACVSRVKSVLSGDDRVESVVVNMLTETAAIRVREEGEGEGVGEEMAERLRGCGFGAKRRESLAGVGDKVRMWRESVERKKELLVESRNRVVFASVLVALCCGAHASHLLHSFGIHVGHGNADTNTSWLISYQMLISLVFIVLIDMLVSVDKLVES